MASASQPIPRLFQHPHDHQTYWSQLEDLRVAFTGATTPHDRAEIVTHLADNILDRQHEHYTLVKTVLDSRFGQSYESQDEEWLAAIEHLQRAAAGTTETRKRKHGQSTTAYEAARKLHLVGLPILNWGRAIVVTAYHWEHNGRPTLESLHQLAQKYPDWFEASLRLDAALAHRHQRFYHGEPVGRVGDCPSNLPEAQRHRFNSQSPVIKMDVERALWYTPDTLEIDRKLFTDLLDDPPLVLPANARNLTEEAIIRLHLTLDRHGLLVPAYGVDKHNSGVCSPGLSSRLRWAPPEPRTLTIRSNVDSLDQGLERSPDSALNSPSYAAAERRARSDERAPPGQCQTRQENQEDDGPPANGQEAEGSTHQQTVADADPSHRDVMDLDHPSTSPPHDTPISSRRGSAGKACHDSNLSASPEQSLPSGRSQEDSHARPPTSPRPDAVSTSPKSGDATVTPDNNVETAGQLRATPLDEDEDEVSDEDADEDPVEDGDEVPQSRSEIADDTADIRDRDESAAEEALPAASERSTPPAHSVTTIGISRPTAESAASVSQVDGESHDGDEENEDGENQNKDAENKDKDAEAVDEEEEDEEEEDDDSEHALQATVAGPEIDAVKELAGTPLPKASGVAEAVRKETKDDGEQADEAGDADKDKDEDEDEDEQDQRTHTAALRSMRDAGAKVGHVAAGNDTDMLDVEHAWDASGAIDNGRHMGSRDEAAPNTDQRLEDRVPPAHQGVPAAPFSFAPNNANLPDAHGLDDIFAAGFLDAYHGGDFSDGLTATQPTSYGGFASAPTGQPSYELHPLPSYQSATDGMFAQMLQDAQHSLHNEPQLFNNAQPGIVDPTIDDYANILGFTPGQPNHPPSGQQLISPEPTPVGNARLGHGAVPTLSMCPVCHPREYVMPRSDLVPCYAAILPDCYKDSTTRSALFRKCHDAWEIYRRATTRAGLATEPPPIRLAKLYYEPGDLGSSDCPREQADAWVLSHDVFISYADQGYIFMCPVIIRERFRDTYSLQECMVDLPVRFRSGKGIQVHSPVDDELKTVSVSDLLEDLKSGEHGFNALDMMAWANKERPLFTGRRRFQVLEQLIHRLTGLEKEPSGQTVDMRGCLGFDILGCASALTGPHLDALGGGTYVRTLFGKKVWWIVPHHLMGKEDWTAFQNMGSAWDTGDKDRGLLLEQHDVLFMPRPIVHRVLTVESSLMEGGMLWDQADLESVLTWLHYIGTFQKTTNEPIARQQHLVLQELEAILPCTVFEHRRNELSRLLGELRQLSCRCEAACVQTTCPCWLAGRRCTPNCGPAEAVRTPRYAHGRSGKGLPCEQDHGGVRGDDMVE